MIFTSQKGQDKGFWWNLTKSAGFQPNKGPGVDKLNIQIRNVKCLHKHYFKRSLLSTYALYVSCQIIFGNLPIFIDFFVKNQYEYNLWRHNETQKRKILNKMAYILSSQCISYNLSWYWSINPNLKFTLKKWAILGPYRTYSFKHGCNLGTPHYRIIDGLDVSSDQFFYNSIWIENQIGVPISVRAQT